LLMCVGLALVLILTKYQRPIDENFCLASFLVNKINRLLVDDKAWKRKDLHFLIRPGKRLLSSEGHKSL